MRLIDLDDHIYCGEDGNYERYNIDPNIPTIDAVPVVRCRDCRWGEEKCGNIECGVDMNVPPEYHGYDWFCPNGERRRENE